MVFQEIIEVTTRGRGSQDLSGRIAQAVTASGMQTGLCHVFVHHTSASLMICENADPEVRTDLERFMARLVPDGDPLFHHVDEGPDDMPAHVRSILTGCELTLPVTRGVCSLGTWQGVYLWEHRTRPHQRRITLTLYGE